MISISMPSFLTCYNQFYHTLLKLFLTLDRLFKLRDSGGFCRAFTYRAQDCVLMFDTTHISSVPLNNFELKLIR